MPFCSLRQSVVLIAAIDLMVSGFFLFILALGSAHAHDMSCVLEADMEDPDRTADTESGRVNNEMRLHNAQKLASATLITLYTIMCLVSIHLLSSMSLLFGSILRIRQFLVPWSSAVLIEIILGTALLMNFIWVGEGTGFGYISAAITLQIYLCFWFVVWHYYQNLSNETCERRMESDTIVTEFKAGYISFPNDKAQNV